ncbi:MAG: hypothetical protein K5930_09660 [Treponemataceae bacterium]|nr:hypothetical protein [Treponemataceae bacterium]
MKKRVISIVITIILIFAAVSPVAAFDLGGQLDTSISMGGRQWFTDNFGGVIGATERASVWFRTPLPFGTLSLEGGWNLNVSYGFVWPLTLFDAQVFNFLNTLDLRLAKYNFAINIGSLAMDFNVGRFPLSDSTGLIFNQNIDALYVSLPFSLFTVSAGAGYTGLLNAKTSGVYGIPVDIPADSFYVFAPGYVAVLSRITAPSLIAGQTFDADVNLFINCNTTESSDSRTRFYATVGAHGPIIPLLYYNASFCFGYAMGPEQKLGVLGNAGLSFYPNFLSSTISFNTLFVTKDFLPFTDIPLSVDGMIGCSNVLKLALAFSMKPVDKWLANTEVSLFYSSVDEVSSFVLNELQANLNVKFQWFSDFCLSASGGVVIPVSDTSVSFFTASVRAQLSF